MMERRQHIWIDKRFAHLLLRLNTRETFIKTRIRPTDSKPLKEAIRSLRPTPLMGFYEKPNFLLIKTRDLRVMNIGERQRKTRLRFKW